MVASISQRKQHSAASLIPVILVTGLQTYCPRLFMRKGNGQAGISLLPLTAFSSPVWYCPCHFQQNSPFMPICTEERVTGYQQTESPGTTDQHTYLKCLHFSAANLANNKISIKITYSIWYVKSTALSVSSLGTIPLIWRTLEVHNSISDSKPPELL